MTKHYGYMVFSKYKKFTLFYFLIIFLNFFLLNYFTSYHVVIKPMIMASLIGFYISTVEGQSNSFVLAMICALLGDVFLLFDGDVFFQIGLGFFLIMQILYTLNFSKDRDNNINKALVSGAIVYAIAIGILYYLWNGLGALKVPVVIYCIAISTMVISAINRKKSIIGYSNLVVGVMLFLISDAVIAITKFGGPFDGQNYVIKGTYMLAQYLIVTSMVECHQSKVVRL